MKRVVNRKVAKSIMEKLVVLAVVFGMIAWVLPQDAAVKVKESKSVGVVVNYDVTLNTVGGTIAKGKNVTSYTWGSVTVLPAYEDMYKKDHIFVGWYADSQYTGNSVASIGSTETGDKEYWARWISKDECKITINKSAEWIEYNGVGLDDENTKYVKIKFDVDLTDSLIKELNKKVEQESTDVVMILDTSGSMRGNAAKEQFNTAKDLVTQIFASGSNNIRFACAGFATYVTQWVSLNSADAKNPEAIKSKLTQAYKKGVTGNTGMQAGIVWGQRQFRDYSTATNKIMILLSDGQPTASNYNSTVPKGDDIVKSYTIASAEGMNSGVTTSSLNTGSNNMTICSVEDTYDMEEEPVMKIAAATEEPTENPDKNNVSSTIDDIYGGMLGDNSNGNNLSEEEQKAIQQKIDAEIKDTNTRAKRYVNSTARMCIGQMEKAREMVPGLHVITVGMNMPSSDNSATVLTLRAMATFDAKGDRNFYKCTAGQSAGNIDTLTQVMQDVTSYVINLNNFKLVDKIPDAYEVVNGTVSSSDSSITSSNVNNQLTFDFSNADLENKVYSFEFILKLDVNKLDEEFREDGTKLYTNGVTVDTDEDSLGSSYLSFGENNDFDLDSPYLSLKVGKYSRVALHTKGGTIAVGKDVTVYKEKSVTMLPTAQDIKRDHYIFKGWYQDAMCVGDPILFIPETATGNLEFYAKWEPEEYTVKLNPGVATINEGYDITSYKYGEEIVLPGYLDMTYTEYDFLGWYDNASFLGSAVTKITPSDHGNKEYWARFVPTQVVISHSTAPIYAAEGLADVYRAEPLVIDVNSIDKKDIKVYFTEEIKPDSARITDPTVIRNGQETELDIPQDEINEIGNNKGQGAIYLQIEYASGYKVSREIQLRYTTSYTMH